MKRTLTLRGETLVELTATDLAAVNGAGLAATGGCPQSFRVRECIETFLDEGCIQTVGA